jgi:hypothetical protein
MTFLIMLTRSVKGISSWFTINPQTLQQNIKCRMRTWWELSPTFVSYILSLFLIFYCLFKLLLSKEIFYSIFLCSIHTMEIMHDHVTAAMLDDGRAYIASTWCNIFIKIQSITRYTIDFINTLHQLRAMEVFPLDDRSNEIFLHEKEFNSSRGKTFYCSAIQHNMAAVTWSCITYIDKDICLTLFVRAYC